MRTAHLAAFALLSLSSASLTAHEKPVQSWGKTGVSLDTYRNDAVTCGREGYYLDISGTEAVAAFKAASRQIEANENQFALYSGVGAAPQMLNAPISSAQIIAAVHPSRRFAELRKVMSDAVTSCLTRLGYSQFQLTPEQAAQLNMFDKGTTERHAYLHSLGSDAAVLTRQAL